MMRHIENTYRAVLNTIRIGTSTLGLVMDKGVHYVQLQLSPFEKPAKVPYVQHYGFVSMPPIGTQYTTNSIGGNHANQIAIASNNVNSRPSNWNDGDVGFYINPNFYVRLNIQTGEMTFNAPTAYNFMVNNTLIQKINSTGEAVTGTITATGDITSGGEPVSLQHHVHTNGGGTGNSGPPA